MTLAWGKKVSAQFVTLVIALCARLGIPDPSWLMAVMWFESRLKASARNAQSGATGLIQFMPNGSIKELGTTAEALAAMTEEDQLVFVERYFVERGYAGKMKTLADVYMAVFWPAAIGKPDNTPLITDEKSKAYVQNKGLDVDKDGQITKAEAASYAVNALAEGLTPNNALELAERPGATASATPNVVPQPVQRGGTRMNILPLLAPVAQVLFQAFGQQAQAKIASAVDKHSDQPGVGQAVADSLSTALVSFAQSVTGKSDPLEAAAVARQDPALVKQAEALAETTALERLQQLSPLLDKSSEYDKAKWQAEREGKDAAADRFVKEKQAGGWDYTYVLVVAGAIVSTLGSMGLIGAVVLQSMAKFLGYEGAAGIDAALVGFAAPLVTLAYSCWKDIIAYRFDGTKESSEQTKALLRVAEGK